MLLDQIKQDIKSARLSRDTQTLESLKSVLGEIERRFKQTDDTTTIRVIKQVIESVETCNKISPKQEYVQEIELLSKYLPIQLSQQELQPILEEQYNQGLKTIGELMKYLKQNYEGRYDGKQANFIIQAILRGSD